METTQNSSNQLTESPTSESVSAPQKNNNMLYVVIFLVLALITGMLYFVISKNQNSTQATQRGNVVSPEVNPESSKSPEEQEAEAVDVKDPATTDLLEAEKDIKGL